jgi:hypothetical protein
MTTTVTEITKNIIAATTYNTLSRTFGIVAIALLTILLVQKELIRASDDTGASVRIRTLNIAIVPLLIVFGLTILRRLLDFIF